MMQFGACPTSFGCISAVNIVLHHFFRDAGPKCPVDNERLSEAQVSDCFLSILLKMQLLLLEICL